ncbi:MAG TPA: PEP-CTERM sorting domain-containing protein [Sphingomonas sp.]|nr:PEP-CTERM sorting domain-containing protein [Sphingomonas sp.]
MLRKTALIALASGFALMAASPAMARHHFWPWGGSSGGTAPAPSSSGGATSVPEPTDAVLFLLGAAGIVIGRKLQSRKRD